MKRNVKISTQLQVGFLIVLAFVVLLGGISYFQTNRLYQQEKDLYEYPLQIRRAVDQFNIDILKTRVAVRDYLLFSGETDRRDALETMELSLSDIHNQYESLKALYKGSQKDIEAVDQALLQWSSATETRMNMALAGETESTVSSLGDQGDVGRYRLQLMAAIDVVDRNATDTAGALNASFVSLYQALSRRSLALLATVLVLSVLISVYLVRQIRKPLQDLNREIQRFHRGELGARCRYTKDNELGALASSFNSMADSLEQSIDVREKFVSLSGAMLSHEDSKGFFRTVLIQLSEALNANTAAVYLPSDDKKTFVCFDSIGLGGDARQRFDAEALEGELGPVLATRSVRRVSQLPEDTRFRYLTSSGEFVPRELLTVPVFSGNEIAAVLSFGTLTHFYGQAERLVNALQITMNARVEGILAFQTIKDMLKTVEQQNRELDMQKNELSAQAAELTQQNTELEIQGKQLAEASRLKTSFLSNMSHELRTPLNSIIALSGVLNRRLVGQIPGEEHGYIEIVERNGKHLLELINDILDISRIEAGREEVEVSEFSLSRTITEITTMLQPLAAQKGIRLVWQPEGADLSLAGDEPKCRHIIQNIVGNAVKFTETGSVTVTAQAREDGVIVTVRDTGIGIDPKYLSSIFNEFSQADGTTSRRFGGTGLGLAIAKKYADLLGGSITVDSAVGQGSTFTVVLPLKYHKEAPATEEAPFPTHPPQTSPRAAAGDTPPQGKALLLIEDSAPAIIQIRDLLEESGYRIRVASNAREAYALIDEELPDAIVLDLMMPEIDGFGVLKTLRATEKTADIPVTILTAKQISADELKELKRNHVYQIVQKGGVDRAALLSVISKMLGPEPQAAPSGEKRNRREGKPCILVVEDNPDNRTTLKALIGMKYTLIEAEDGEQGIALARELLPDLVLMDIALPGISGIDAFHTLRDAPATQHIPIVALTASVMTQERDTIMSHGFDAFIAKPLVTDDLFKVIRGFLYD